MLRLRIGPGWPTRQPEHFSEHTATRRKNEDLELVPAAWDGNLALLVDTVRDRFLLWLGTGHCTKQARRAGLQLVRQ